MRKGVTMLDSQNPGLTRPDELIKAVREGLEYSYFEALQSDLELSQQALTELLAITPRTLQNRKHLGRFTPQESDHLLRIARVFTQVKAFFGTAEQARDWLKKSAYAFNDQTPLSLLDTEIGAEQVTILIKRLDYGVLP